MCLIQSGKCGADEEPFPPCRAVNQVVRWHEERLKGAER